MKNILKVILVFEDGSQEELEKCCVTQIKEDAESGNLMVNHQGCNFSGQDMIHLAYAGAELLRGNGDNLEVDLGEDQE